MGDQTNNATRDRWGSKIAFIMAAVGFAVGFGNVWRFPSLAYEYGGGAFFIPYIMALLFIGIPLAILEVSLGQYHQTGDVGVFGSIQRRLKGVGLGSVIAAWVVVTYYTPLIAWVVNAFFDTFRNAAIWENSSGSEAYDYFLDHIIGEKTLGPDFRPTRMVWANVGYIAVTWFVIWLCLAWGIEATGKVTYFTMGLPAILIFVFLGRAVSLPGSSDGINAYIGEWDMSVLVNQPECWSRAVSQIFFSIGVTFVSHYLHSSCYVIALCQLLKKYSSSSPLPLYRVFSLLLVVIVQEMDQPFRTPSSYRYAIVSSLSSLDSLSLPGLDIWPIKKG